MGKEVHTFPEGISLKATGVRTHSPATRVSQYAKFSRRQK